MRYLLASLLFAGACSSAYADRVGAPQLPGPRIAIGVANEKVRAPYDVQVVRENGETLPTYALKDRYYVQGNASERYTIRITNPTANRVEAVVSVDGLDVVDGEGGDLRKRGYIVPGYGEVRIEGFRTSLEDVATFRFSSVDGSYAGQKGKARNVGVIAVAIFEEQAAPVEQQQIIVAPEPTPNRVYNWSDDVDASRAPSGRGGATGSVAKVDRAPVRDMPAEASRPSSTPPAPTRAKAADKKAEAPRTASVSGGAASRHYENYGGDDDGGGYYQPTPPTQEAPQPTNRQGLGTEYGEQRSSGASYTRFVRNAARPIAIAELRYNDAAGLTALGIMLQPLPDAGEIMTRETADPFPGDPHFSRPAR
ncbi:MAG: hypothetical protein JWO36_219 [Myxococcales bacterium]|nr:hypothetical protein [Myxococcales bacterium]